jgi:hypothetical protein
MAPRGIIAATTASTFSATLAQKGVAGASKILPATFRGDRGDGLRPDRRAGGAAPWRHPPGSQQTAARRGLPVGYDLLLLIRADGRLVPVTAVQTPATEPGDRLLLLGSPGRSCSR